MEQPQRMLVSHQMWKDLVTVFHKQGPCVYTVRIPLPQDATTSLLRRIGCAV